MIPIFSLSAPVALPHGRPLILLGEGIAGKRAYPGQRLFRCDAGQLTVLFDAGTKAEQYALLEKADRTLDNILRAIRLNWSNFFRVKKGRGAGVLSKIVNPAFRRGLKTKPFYVTEDCSHCGLCERVCTSGCIRLTAGIPVWTEKHCNMCMACVNRCPQTAIQYGKSTTKRGRYVHPIYQNRKGESE